MNLSGWINRLTRRERAFTALQAEDPFAKNRESIERKLLQLEAHMQAVIDAERKIYMIQNVLKKSKVRVPVTLEEAMQARANLDAWQSGDK